MSLISDREREELLASYDAGSELWRKYPELEKYRDHIFWLANLDRANVFQLSFAGVLPSPAGSRVYVATAGAPATGKSTVLDQQMHEAPERYGGAVRVDPDLYGMRGMLFTYHDFLLSPRLVAQAGSYHAAQRRAYDAARAWSNVLAQEVLNAAFSGPYSIAHGTTMTSDNSETMLRYMKASGRSVELLVCAAPKAVQDHALQTRQGQGNYQVTQADFQSKTRRFREKISLYFQHADKLVIFWRPDPTSNAILAATYSSNGVDVTNTHALDAFWSDYEYFRSADCRYQTREAIERGFFSRGTA